MKEVLASNIGLPFLPAAKPRRSMDGKISVGGTGAVHFLGIFCEIELKSNSDISN